MVNLPYLLGALHLLGQKRGLPDRQIHFSFCPSEEIAGNTVGFL